MGPVDDLPESIFGRNCCALGVCVKQKQGLEVAPDALGDHIFPPGSNLFHICIIKKYPFGTLGMKRKGTIMSAGVADHADKVKFTIFGIFISNPIKKLFKKQCTFNTESFKK